MFTWVGKSEDDIWKGNSQGSAGSTAELGLAHPVHVVGGTAAGEAAVADGQRAGLAVVLRVTHTNKTQRPSENCYE